MKTIEGKNFDKWFENLHSSTKQVYMCDMMNIPVGCSTYEEAIQNNPEEFEEEIEYRNKWNSIPSEVVDKYYEETTKIDNDHFDNAPHKGMGIIWYMEHPKEDKERNDWLDTNRHIRQKKLKEIHNKYIAPYGIEYNE